VLPCHPQMVMTLSTDQIYQEKTGNTSMCMKSMNLKEFSYCTKLHARLKLKTQQIKMSQNVQCVKTMLLSFVSTTMPTSARVAIRIIMKKLSSSSITNVFQLKINTSFSVNVLTVLRIEKKTSIMSISVTRVTKLFAVCAYLKVCLAKHMITSLSVFRKLTKMPNKKQRTKILLYKRKRMSSRTLWTVSKEK
jgi:hypothetical protein